MKIRVNGSEMDISANLTIAALLAQLGYTPGACAVARNLEFVPRSEYANTTLGEDDDIEIVLPRQGG